MDTDKLVYFVTIGVTIILSLAVIWRSSQYCLHHPNGVRRIGAWALIVSCILYDVHSVQILTVSDSIHSIYGWDMFALALNQLAMFVAAIMLMRRNPVRVIDPDDIDAIIDHFKEAECDFATKYRQAKEKEKMGGRHD